MKTITTTREYDDQGRIVKETTVIEGDSVDAKDKQLNGFDWLEHYRKNNMTPLPYFPQPTHQWIPGQTWCGTSTAVPTSGVGYV